MTYSQRVREGEARIILESVDHTEYSVTSCRLQVSRYNTSYNAP